MKAPGRSLLSRPQIRRHLEEGTVVVHPLDERSINTASYDVRIAPWFFREQEVAGESPVFNPFDEEHVRRLWGDVQRAVPAGGWMQRNGPLRNFSDMDFLVVLKPGETILSHTIEFIGGRRTATTEMRARSSMGRIGITVCKCAGWGDVGYITRWTMEITNLMRHHTIPLPVGMRVAQIAFYEVDEEEGASYAGEGGKYQDSDDLEEVMRLWSPEQMLPRLHLDRDIGHFHTFIPQEFLSTEG